MKRVIVILIKVRSLNTLLLMLLVFISSYLKSDLRYKSLILVYIIRTLYLSKEGSEDLWLFSEAKGARKLNHLAALV